MKQKEWRGSFFCVLAAGVVAAGILFCPFRLRADECEAAFEAAAKSYYQQKKSSALTADSCRQLRNRFQTIAEKWPECGQADDSLYLAGLLGKMAFSLEGKAEDLARSREAFTSLLTKYPESPLANKSRAKLKEIDEKQAGNSTATEKNSAPAKTTATPSNSRPAKPPTSAAEKSREEGKPPGEAAPKKTAAGPGKSGLAEDDLSAERESVSAAPGDTAAERAQLGSIEDIIRAAAGESTETILTSPGEGGRSEELRHILASLEPELTPAGAQPAKMPPSPPPPQDTPPGEQAPAPADYAWLDAIRYWTSPDYTRVVIELSRETGFSPPELLPANPELGIPPRLYVDFLEAAISPSLADPQTPEPGCFTLPIGDGLLKKVRAGQYQPTAVRVVLDIERIENFQSFPLPGEKFRFVIDVYGSAPGSSAPAARSGKEKSSPAAEALGDEGAGLNEWFRQQKLFSPGGKKKFLVVLDPGHGGKDPGARGPSGAREKDLTLALALATKRALEIQRDDIEVILTRRDDRFLSLEERTAIANTLDADLFVSIHINAAPNRQATGVETYYLDNTTDRAALRLAAAENFVAEQSLLDAEDSTNRILADLITASKIEESVPLARLIQKALVAELRKVWPAVEDKGVKKGPFWVLTGATMPCVLVEVGFISNPVEEKQLLNITTQKAAAAGIAAGISAYLDSSPRLSRNE